ncbi:BTAD domain-containing putative transcriptional regulator [Nocardia sp. NPDC051030]|uniref:AfsR/SARP family transcriptional regulator n=1 Tax=Nocardia sp. NPDC051030 TaxID=3155162 RepID=UPI00342AD225
MLRLSLLGPVEVSIDGGGRLSLQPKQQVVLAMLVVGRGRAVSVEELVGGIWEGNAPTSAVGAVRNNVWSLRKAIAGPGETGIESLNRGYRLSDAVGVWVDLDEVERWGAVAEAARGERRWEAASEAVEAALGMWRGDPFGGLAGPWVSGERARLRELRTGLLVSGIEIAIERGDNQRAINELQPLLRDEPHNERFPALLMTALHRGGRRTDALNVFLDVRRRMIGELGLEPGHELTDLHRRILADEVTSVPTRAARQSQAPAQLPPDAVDFTGRQATVTRLVEDILGAESTAIETISGMGGLGKTTLAVRVGHQLAEQFPDGQLFVDLHGAGGLPPADPELVLGEFLRALDVTESDIPAGLAQRSALYRSVLDERRVLIILDNAANSTQVSALLPGSRHCATLITSRRPITTFAGGRIDHLAMFEESEAIELIGRIVGRDRVADEAEAVARLVELCGYLPLAIRIMAARLASRPTWTIASEVERLIASDDLAPFSSDGRTVDAVFQAGYTGLAPEEARAFELLSVLDGPDIPVAMAAAILGTAVDDAEQLCESLVDAGMLQSPQRERYRYHDLLRTFARNLPDPEGARAVVLPRAVDFYLATVRNLTATRNPGMGLDHLATATHPGITFADDIETGMWLDAEQSNLLALYRGIVCHTELLATSVDMAMLIVGTMHAGEMVPQLVDPLTALVAATVAAGDRMAEGRARTTLALAKLLGLSEGVAAYLELHSSLDLLREHDDLPVIAQTELLMGTAATVGGFVNIAIAHFHTTITLAEQLGDRWQQAIGWTSTARTACYGGLADQAIEAAERGLVLSREIGARGMESWALGELGWALSLRDGPTEPAFAACREAVDIARAAHRRLEEGWALSRLADVTLRSGDAATAARYAADGMEALEDAHEPGGQVRLLMIQARALIALGHDAEAEAILDIASRMRERLGGLPLVEAQLPETRANPTPPSA